MDDGSATMLGGGVDGAKILDDRGPALAGEGDVARYKSKSAPSSPAALCLRERNGRSLVGGGVRGGEEWNFEEFKLKECSGRRGSSSDMGPNGGDIGTVDVCETNERFGSCETGTRVR